MKKTSALLRNFWASMVALPVIVSGGVAAAESAPERPLEKVTFAYSSLSGNMAPLWITHERGLFRKYGLDVQLVFIESGSTTVQSLISKDVAFAQMAGAGAVQSRLRGSDVVMIAGAVNTLTFKFFVDKNIQRPEQLKGTVAAVTRFGSSTDFALRYALERYGLVPDRDVTILQAGNMPAIVAGLEAGKIQAAMLSAPFTLRAKNLGLPLLADLQMLGLEYQHTGLATTQSLIKSRPDLVRNVMKAYVEGIHFYKTRRAESLAILAKYLKTNDADVLAEVYDDIGLKLTPEKPYPTVRGIGLMLRELAAGNPKNANARPEDFVDLSFVKELDSSGFIERLYKTSPVLASREKSRSSAANDEKAGALGGKEKAIDSANRASAPETASAAGRVYTVEAGDTLIRLASRYYGDGNKWDRIFQANKPSMKNPDFIFVGQKIVIPS
jgi:NitT/TauT family transport system substrate-binding protein